MVTLEDMLGFSEEDRLALHKNLWLIHNTYDDYAPMLREFALTYPNLEGVYSAFMLGRISAFSAMLVNIDEEWGLNIEEL